MPQDNRLIPDEFDAGASANAPKLAIPLGGLSAGESADRSHFQIDNPLTQQSDEFTHHPQAAGPRAINLRFLLFVTIALLVTGIGVASLREYQMSRVASLYVKRSEAAEKNGDLSKAASYQQQYLRLVPDDVDARARFAQLLIDGANTPQKQYNATMTIERLLRDDADQHEIRRQLVDLYMGFGQYISARAHVDFLLKHSPSSSELHLLKGRCYDSEGSTTHAVTSYKTAIQLDPRNLDAYQFLARTLYDNVEESAEADETMNQMVMNNRGSYRALLARAEYHRHLGRREMANIDAIRAFQTAPEENDVIILIAQLLSEDRQLGESDRSNKLAASFDLSSMRDMLDLATQKEPQRIELWAALASLEWGDGRLDAAERALRRAVATDPTNANVIIALFDLLLIKGETDNAQQELLELRQQRAVSNATATFLESQLAMANKKWQDATHLLNSIPLQKLSPTLRSRIGLDLGQCYAELGNAERRLEAIRSTVENSKRSNSLRQQYASALAATGRHVDALAQYRQMPQSAAVRVEIARLLLAHQLTLSPTERDWSKVDAAIDQAAQSTANRGNVALLRAEALSAQGEFQRAEQLLEQTCERLPNEPAIWIGWSRAVRENGRPDRALEIIAQAEEQLGEQVLFLLERIVHWQQVAGEQANRELLRIREEIATRPTAEQDRLLKALASAFAASGQFAEADDALAQLIERNPGNLSLWLLRLDIALSSKEPDAAQNISVEIRRLDGEDGSHWRYAEAMRLANLAAREGNENAEQYLAQARTLLAEVDAQFESSPRVPLALARLEEQQGNFAAASDHLIEAIKRGDHSQSVVERAVHRLLLAGRINDAQQILQQYAGQDMRTGSRFLGRMGIAASLRSKNFQAAIEVAQGEVQRDPSSADARLVFGQVLRMAGRLPEAESELRKAWELAPDRPAVVLTLVRFLAATNQTEAAITSIKQAKLQLPAELREVTVARCFLELRQRDVAEKHFLLALENQPDNGGVLIAVAQFYLELPDPKRAKSILQRVLALGDKVTAAELAAARRSLALMLVGRKKYNDFQTAWSLLNDDDGNSANTNADLHAKAVVLAASPHRDHQRQAVDFLEQLNERRTLTSGEQRLLTDLYLHIGNWEKARDALLVLVIGNEGNLDVLAYGVRIMFGHNDNGRLPKQWLETLVKRAPNNLQTTELRVIDLVLENDLKQAIGLVNQTVDKLSTENLKRAAVTNRFGKLLSSLGERRELAGRTLEAEKLFEAAEKFHRESIKASPKYLVSLTRFLSRRWRDKDAVALLDDIWKTNAPETVAALCVEILREGRVSKPDVSRIRARLNAAVSKYPDSGILLYHTGNVAQLDGDYEAAIGLYQRSIQQIPNLAEAHNELAMLLILYSGQPVKALESINRAIDLAGPIPAFVDTRSLAYLKLEKPAKSVRDSEQAVSDNPTAARRFHLAQALEAIDEPQAARREFQQAIASGLRADVLHPLERAAFEEMRERFRRPA